MINGGVCVRGSHTIMAHPYCTPTGALRQVRVLHTEERGHHHQRETLPLRTTIMDRRSSSRLKIDALQAYR